MVIKGSARAAPGELAYHLLREDTNELVTVLELSGVASRELRGALLELDGMGAGSRSRRTLYHASINTPVSEQLDPDQQRRARERLAERMGLDGQPYVAVQHVKHGRQHTHVVWSRIEVETGLAIHDAFNYRKHEEVARELEREFGHERVLGAHVRDKALERRPERGPTWGEQRQAERSGMTPEHAKAAVSYAWELARNGTEFARCVEREGFMLARGDRKDFVLVDEAGQIHGLTRRLRNVRASDVREKLADLDPEQFPTIAAVRAEIRAELRAEQRQIDAHERTADRERIAAFYGQHPDEGPQYLSAIERQRIEEQRSSAPQHVRDLASAIHQLKQTLGPELGEVILASDRRTADPSWQKLVAQSLTAPLEDRRPITPGDREYNRLREIEPPVPALETKPAPQPEGRRETFMERMRRLIPFTDEELAAEKQRQQEAQWLRNELNRGRSRQRVWVPDRKD